MKIRKHGKMFKQDPPPLAEKFTCNNCNCEFSALNDEYYVDEGGAGNYSSSSWSSSLTYTWTSTVKDYLVCSCPECHKIVKKVRERDNSNKWYTVTCNNNDSLSNATITGANYYTDKKDYESISVTGASTVLNSVVNDYTASYKDDSNKAVG